MTIGEKTQPQLKRFSNFQLVGRGGFGEVFVADDSVLQRRVAIKRFFRPSSEIADIRESLTACAALQHPHVSQVLDLIESSGQLLLVQTYCSGGSLADRLVSRPPQYYAAVQHFLEVAGAVAYLHRRRLLHRDLKLANVLLTSDNTTTLIDLDHCVAFPDSGFPTPAARSFLGTPAYMAPELLNGTGVPSIASEVYALGLMLFELLSGRLLSDEQNLAQAVSATVGQGLLLTSHSVPDAADWNAIIGKATASIPVRRYESVNLLMEDVENQLHGRPISVRRLHRWERGARWARRYPLTAALAVSAFVLPTAAALVSALAWQQTQRAKLRSDANRARLERSLEQADLTKRELAMLVNQVEAELFSAEQSESAQAEAAREAMRIEHDLTAEARRMEKLRNDAADALAQANAARAELTARQRDNATINDELQAVLSENVILNYVDQFRQAWTAVKNGSWEEAERLAGQLDAEMRGTEFIFLRQAIASRRTAPVKITLGRYPSNDDANGLLTAFSLRGNYEWSNRRPIHSLRSSLELNQGNNTRSLDFVHTSSDDFYFKLNFGDDDHSKLTEQKLLLTLVLTADRKRMKGIIGILPNGSIVTRMTGPHQTIDEIVIFTFDAAAYESGYRMLSNEQIEDLMRPRLAIANKDVRLVEWHDGTRIALSETVMISQHAFSPNPEFELVGHDPTASIRALEQVGEITTVDWDGETKAMRWLGQITVQQAAFDPQVQLQLEHLSANRYMEHLCISEDRKLLFTDRKFSRDLILVDLESGAISNTMLRGYAACFDPRGGLFFVGTSGPLMYSKFSNGRFSEPAVAKVGTGETVGRVIPICCDGEHLYVREDDGVKRIALSMGEGSRTDWWLRVGFPTEQEVSPQSRLRVGHQCIIDKNRVLVSLSKRYERGLVTVLLDRQRSGIWLCDRPMGVVAVVPGSGELVAFDGDGRLCALTLTESPDFPGGLADVFQRSRESMSRSGIDPAVLEGAAIDLRLKDDGSDRAFVRIDGPQPRCWVEVRADDRPIFVFDELRGDQEFVFLVDRHRKMILRMPLSGGRVHLSTDNGKSWAYLCMVAAVEPAAADGAASG